MNEVVREMALDLSEGLHELGFLEHVPGVLKHTASYGRTRRTGISHRTTAAQPQTVFECGWGSAGRWEIRKAENQGHERPSRGGNTQRA